MSKIIATSAGAPQVVKKNIAEPSGFDYYPYTQLEDIAAERPDLLLLGGWYVDNLVVFWQHKAIVGDCERVAIHWFGSDVNKCSNMYMDGERKMFEYLREDRFLHIPCSDKIKEELEDRLGLEPCEPLIVPAQKRIERMDAPDRFAVAVYLPSTGLEFYNSGAMVDALEELKIKTIFYHFLFKSYHLDFIGPHEFRYGLNREEYEQVIADSSILLRVPDHDGMSVGAAEFLMAGRHVVSTHDLPMWEANAELPVTKDNLVKVLGEIRDQASLIPPVISDQAREVFDPALYRAGFAERVKDKWGFPI